MDFREFVQKWSASSSAERANAQPFLTDLCGVLGVERPRPTTGDLQLDLFVFEHDALISHEGGKVSVGKIDLYKEDISSSKPSRVPRPARRSSERRRGARRTS
jgi:hypothetical protein